VDRAGRNLQEFKDVRVKDAHLGGGGAMGYAKHIGVEWDTVAEMAVLIARQVEISLMLDPLSLA